MLELCDAIQQMSASGDAQVPTEIRICLKILNDNFTIMMNIIFHMHFMQ